MEFPQSESFKTLLARQNNGLANGPAVSFITMLAFPIFFGTTSIPQLNKSMDETCFTGLPGPRRSKSAGDWLLICPPILQRSAPVRIRTSNLLIRSQMLYPVELRVLRLKTGCELSRASAGVQYFPPPLQSSVLRPISTILPALFRLNLSATA